jgi:hypothetical protein
VTNTDRLIAYLARVAAHRASDPLDYAIRFRRGQMLQALPFPWRLAARGTVLTLRKRRA